MAAGAMSLTEMRLRRSSAVQRGWCVQCGGALCACAEANKNHGKYGKTKKTHSASLLSPVGVSCRAFFSLRARTERHSCGCLIERANPAARSMKFRTAFTLLTGCPAYNFQSMLRMEPIFPNALLPGRVPLAIDRVSDAFPQAPRGRCVLLESQT